jgi:hypothetical protein
MRNPIYNITNFLSEIVEQVWKAQTFLKVTFSNYLTALAQWDDKNYNPMWRFFLL